MIQPKFNKTLPKDWKKFFAVDSDNAFKREHPIAYPVLVIIAMAAFILPAVIVYNIWQAVVGPESDLVLLVVIGGAVIGIGLFNIVAAFLHQHLGHKVTIISILLGLLLIAISFIIA